MHVHVSCAEGEAKFWIDPEIVLARNHGIGEAELTSIRKIIEEHRDEIAAARDARFRR